MKAFEFVSHCLRAYGCEIVFGVPGSLVMSIWQNLSGIEIVLCSHEQEAAYAAVGYAKQSGKLAAVVTTGGPGVTNAVSGIASANLDSVPVVYLSGRTPDSASGMGLRQEEGSVDRAFESTDLLRSVTIQSVRASADLFPLQMEQCCKLAVSGRAGCTHISIPTDLQNRDIGDIDMPSLLRRGAESRAERIEVPAVPELRSDDRPLIIMGWGCWLDHAVDAVYDMADHIQAPVLTTVKGYSCIRRSPMFLGKLGYGFNPFLSAFLQSYHPSVVLAFGTTLGYKDIPEKERSFLLDAAVWVYSADTQSAVCRLPSAFRIETASLRNAAVAIRQHNALRNDSELKTRIQAARKQQLRYFLAPKPNNSRMADAILALNRMIGPDVTITADAGNHLLDVSILISPQENGSTLILNDGIRSMGSGICETVGMAIANPTRKYISVTGDGCMLMNGNVMALIARRKLPVLLIIMDNGTLGRVRVGQMRKENKFIATDLGNVDFSKYASAFGLSVFEPTDAEAFSVCVADFLAAPRPTAIIYHTGPDEIPLALLAAGEWN